MRREDTTTLKVGLITAALHKANISESMRKHDIFVVDICGKALYPNKAKGCGLNAFSMSVRFRLYPLIILREVMLMYCRELGIYINYPTTKYVALDNGKVVKRSEISDEEYEALKEWECIIREFER